MHVMKYRREVNNFHRLITINKIPLKNCHFESIDTLYFLIKLSV